MTVSQWIKTELTEAIRRYPEIADDIREVGRQARQLVSELGYPSSSAVRHMRGALESLISKAETNPVEVDRCPQCGEILVYANTDNTEKGVDIYCEECGYPDEYRGIKMVEVSLRLDKDMLEDILEMARKQIVDDTDALINYIIPKILKEQLENRESGEG